MNRAKSFFLPTTYLLPFSMWSTFSTGLHQILDTFRDQLSGGRPGQTFGQFSVVTASTSTSRNVLSLPQPLTRNRGPSKSSTVSSS